MPISTFIRTFLFILSSFGLLLYLYSSRKLTINNAVYDTPSVSPRLRFSHLKLYLLALAIEWLQHPYLFRLYADYCVFNHFSIAILYLMGIILTPILIPIVLSLTENLNSFLSIICYTLISFLSITLKSSCNYRLQLFSRILQCVSAPALIICIDDWFNHEISKVQVYSKHSNDITSNSKIHSIFFQISVSFMAIFSGLIADFFAEFLNLGYVSPFLISIIPLGLIQYVNYKNRIFINTTPYSRESNVQPIYHHMIEHDCICGSTTYHKKTIRCFYLGVIETLLSLKHRSLFLLMIPILQSLIDCTIYVFLFSWTPLLELSVKQGSSDLTFLPLGAIYSCFMVGTIIGGLFYDILTNFKTSHTKLMVIVSLSIFIFNFMISIYSPLGHQYPRICFLTLVCLEIAYGLYTPCIQWLRTHLMPIELEQNRFHSQVFDCIIRTPMNLAIIFFILFPLTPKTTRIDEKGSLANSSIHHFYLINPHKLFFASSLLALISLIISILIHSKLFINNVGLNSSRNQSILSQV